MATLELRNRTYAAVFRFGGRKFSRSLKTSSLVEAKRRIANLERMIVDVETGRVELPVGGDVATFLLTDGKRLAKPTIVSLQTLTAQFLRSLPAGALEDSTLYTMNIHLRHLVAVLGSNFAISQLGMAEVQGYINKRQKTLWRGRTPGADTIRKELMTLSSIWNWGVKAGMLKGEFPNKGLRFPKDKEKPPFQTKSEIESQIVGLHDDLQKELWQSLYLRSEEIKELLRTIKDRSTAPFMYPLSVFAAHTGARRSELVRSEVRDFQDDVVVIRERKRVKGRTTTRRVPLSPQLSRVIKEWLNGRSDEFTFPQKDLQGSNPNHHLKRTLRDTEWSIFPGWHCFRHSFISNLASAGTDQRIIDEFVGHSTEEMRRRYRHLLPDVKQAAIDDIFGPE